MNFYVLTLFPEAIAGGLNHSIIKRAISNNIISINCVDIRDFSGDKHNRVDDYPYGGGAGMVIRAAPVYDAYNAIKKKVSEGTRLVYMTPQGKPFNQKTAEEFSKEKDIIILCGHYEGIDERVIETIVTDEISMGDFVLSGGEIPAMAFIDSVSRLIPGVLGKEESFINESFSDNLLEHPQYTRPRVFMDKPVPEVLLSGNHKEIEKWRHEQSLRRTKEKRPDLLK
ncbi:tRNA (guanosine(37)-N1)-methyltransferase TrmD [Anaeropeptidivorans aminofermentans]|uniref:tRNA (guanosine(37)-N1)-methyltransferase TrmD n=1 Tax=Anaeropeptidivorans aminofermentans TaxID=2934315 RepID=UPI0020248334|nr:tRNA (guanosine(37)-N1)-methyltransferase TrmD [Anaeropeptidivorans aminofermentans]